MANNSAVIVTAAPVDYKGMECEYAPERNSKECLAHVIHCVEGGFWGASARLEDLGGRVGSLACLGQHEAEQAAHFFLALAPDLTMV